MAKESSQEVVEYLILNQDFLVYQYIICLTNNKLLLPICTATFDRNATSELVCPKILAIGKINYNTPYKYSAFSLV